MARTTAGKREADAERRGLKPHAPADALDFAALAGLLALIPIRTFVSESYDFATAAWFRNIAPQTTAMPGHTFFFIAAMILCATLVAIAQRIRGVGWQSAGLLAGGALLAIAAIISTLRAGQRHLAIIGSLDFLALLLYAATLRQVLGRPWQQRLALSVILASGAAVVVKCGIQKWVELPATVRLFEEQYRAAMVYGQEDPGRLYDFEQRLKSGAVTAYFSHANVLAGYLILTVMAGVGVTAVRLRRAPTISERGWSVAAIAPAVIAISAFVALIFTQSKGGAAAAVGAILLWGIGRVVRSQPAWSLRFTPMRVATAIWIGMASLSVGVVALLWRNPEALGRSILFRWLYWQGAIDMLRGEGAWGVGANNFGRFFTRYKPVICPEDVQDPHSWIVRALTEWGALGLVAVLVAWLGWTVSTARRWATDGSCNGATASQTSLKSQTLDGDPIRYRGIGAWALILTMATGVVWTVIAWGAAPGMWEQTVLIGAACWLAFFLLVSIESRDERQFSSIPGSADAWALIAGMVAFLIHAAIDLELFWAGPATVFMAMAAVAQATSAKEPLTLAAETAAAAIYSNEDASDRRKRYGILGLGVSAALVILMQFGRPALRLGARLDDARTAPRSERWQDYTTSQAHASYSLAIEATPLDATAIDELSLELTGRIETVEHCDRVMTLLAEWRRRDPHNGAVDQRASLVMTRRFQLGGRMADLDAAIEHMEAAVADSPAAPQRRVALGQLYELKAQSDPVAGLQAAAAYETALDLDERRTLVSAPNRMKPELRHYLKDRTMQLRGGVP